MSILPEIIGYDVVCSNTGKIHAFTVPTAEEAATVASGIEGAIVVPVVNTETARTGYSVG